MLLGENFSHDGLRRSEKGVEKIPVVFDEMAQDSSTFRPAHMLEMCDSEDPPLRHVPIGHVRRHERKARTQDLDPMSVALNQRCNGGAMFSVLIADGEEHLGFMI